MKRLKNNKAKGKGDVSTKFLKVFGPKGKTELFWMCRDILHKNAYRICITA